MSAPRLALNPPWRAVALVGRGVFLETIRRNEFYVLLILTLLFVIAAVVVAFVGIENASTGTFLLNFGMMFAYFSAHIMALLTTARQVPNEIETRQIYPMLAKPLARGHYLVGKWIASWASGAGALAILMALGWGAAPKPETYHAGLLAQALVLHAVSIAMLAAAALLLSLLAPQGVNLVLCALLFMAGEKAAGFVVARAAGTGVEGIARWIGAYVPDFTKLNLVTRYTDGIGPISAMEFLGLVAYGGIFVAACLAAATAIFNRRAL